MAQRISSPDSEQARAFWARFRTVAVRHGVPPKAVVWLERRIRQCIDAFAEVRLKDRTPEHVKSYLLRLISSGELADWQYRQAVEAI